MALITGVTANSPACRAGLRVGERLHTISGRPIQDILDYRFYSYEAALPISVADAGGALRTVVVRKGPGEDPGLAFDSELMDTQRSCVNQCLFCFVDQLPPGLRRGLYFKDDDFRLSFLLGQYVTLTNLTPADIGRILEMRISPLYISVHATSHALRERLLGHPEAGRCLSLMRRLADGGIAMHAQAVVCPGINDGEALAGTLDDLLSIFPAVQSISVVPVGLTRWREGLCPLRPFEGAEAAGIVSLVESLAARQRARHGMGVVYAADEFYLLSGRAPPGEESYDGYPQLDNGVGLLTSFEASFREALPPASLRRPAPFTVATGVAAAPFLSRLLAALANRVPALRYAVEAIPNRLFGDTVTVAGLLCGQDLIDALRGRVVGDRVLIPATMLRFEGDIFLDDLTPGDVSRAIGASVIPVPVDGGCFIESVMNSVVP